MFVQQPSEHVPTAALHVSVLRTGKTQQINFKLVIAAVLVKVLLRVSYVHATTDCVVALDFAEIDFSGLTTDLEAETPTFDGSYVWDEAEVKCLFYNVWQAMRQKFCRHVVILTAENIVALSETYLLHSKFASPMHDEQAMGMDLAFKMWDKHVLPDLVSMRHSRKDHNLCCVCFTRYRTRI